MALAPLSQTIFLTEDGSAVINPTAVTIPPRPIVLPTLAAIFGSGALVTGIATSGAIAGLTAASTLDISVPGLTIDRNAATYAFDGTASAGSYSVIETLAAASNSPRTTSVVVQSPPGSNGSWGGDGTWGGGGSWGGGGGTAPVNITIAVGAITSTAEGSPTPSAGITLSVGAITSQIEGTSSAITLSVGSISSQPEGN